jgi:hypothetical protein
MKRILSCLKYWIVFWIGALLAIVVGVFAYNYAELNNVSPWTPLTSSWYNQLLENVRDLNDRINAMSGTKMIVPDYSNKQTTNLVNWFVSSIVSDSTDWKQYNITTFYAPNDWYIQFYFRVKYPNSNTMYVTSLYVRANDNTLIEMSYHDYVSCIYSSYIQVSKWDKIDFQFGTYVKWVEFVPESVYAFFIPPKIVTLSE